MSDEIRVTTRAGAEFSFWPEALEAIRILPNGDFQLEGLPEVQERSGDLFSSRNFKEMHRGIELLTKEVLEFWFALRAHDRIQELEAALKEKEA